MDNVEGVTLLRIREIASHKDIYDPIWKDAALRQTTGYIYSFLGTTFPNYSHETWLVKPKKIYSQNNKPYVDPIYGYTYVDVKHNNKYLRYTLALNESNKVSTSIDKPTRYAVTYETEVNPEERKYWIANATIKIIDTKDNSLIAEKIIYVFDHGLGSGARGTSGRQPWTHAEKCPQDKIKNNEIRFFTEKVLKPKQPNFNTNNGE